MPTPQHLTIFSIFVIGLLTLAFSNPEYLDDANNKFLSGFVNHEMLGFIGIVVTISLASAANIHIELNRIEEKIAARIFNEARGKIRGSVRALIVLLFASLILVTIKPIVANGSQSQAVVNSFALIVCIGCIQVLSDLTVAAFSLPAIIPDKSSDQNCKR
jgi:hypothetical protein